MKSRRSWSDFTVDPAAALCEPLPPLDTTSRFPLAFTREVIARTVKRGALIFRQPDQSHACSLKVACVSGAPP